MKKINTFWNWFQDNHHTIKTIVNQTPENQKHITFWINKNLNYYCRELDFIIVFPKNLTPKFEFIITANGNKNYFHELITLVDNAPLLKSWKFTAFIQPTTEIDKMMKGLDEPYIFHDITLKISELKFKPILYDENIEKMDIMIFLKNYNLLCDTKTLKQAIYIILQELLGEERLYQKISLVQLAQTTNKEKDLIQLYELQWYLDAL
ncbi:hypothetical protein SAMN05443667_11931 [Flavobacterium gillisiae]|jgi:hypothetical protein|uniref:Uncharacterized protein n=1 Tax=Flavobacterium gillisiae TaxID=150146 RepID=A0A1H4GB57_9FLAO|nr:hypothetical protein [Flavobacterium gillisiae]SEB06677.1 hypothetical protein SAMN05443667_11931 [Flavobacterium gillisiae]